MTGIINGIVLNIALTLYANNIVQCNFFAGRNTIAFFLTREILFLLFMEQEDRADNYGKLYVSYIVKFINNTAPRVSIILCLWVS